MRRVDDRLLREITERLVAELAPDEIRLYGSYVWGTPGEASDLDILVILTSSNERPVARAARAYGCLRDVRVPLDIVVSTREEIEPYRDVRGSLVHRILESGRVLYERPTALAGV